MTTTLPFLRPMVVLLASTLVLSACDQPKSAPQAQAEAPAGKVRPVRAPEPIAWDPAQKAFVLDGKPLQAAALWTFEAGTEGFQGTGSTLTVKTGGGLEVVGTVFDSVIRTPPDLQIKGSEYNTVLVRVSRSKDTPRWDGTVFWTTDSHGESGDFQAKPLRGADPAVGETTIMVYDVAGSKKGGNDWSSSVIRRLRLDLDDDIGGAFTVYQVAVVNVPGGVSPPAAPAVAPPATQ